MDVKEYISSGILESYVLGAASDHVQCLSSIYPQIIEALRALEVNMETFAKSLAKAPSADLKQKAMATIENVAKESALRKGASLSSDNINVVQPSPMVATKTKRPWLAAASLAALIALTAIFL